MFVHGVSSESEVTFIMNQYSLMDQGPALNEPRQRSWNSTSVSPSVVAAVTPSKILACTQISKPTVDHVIDHSLVTYLV